MRHWLPQIRIQVPCNKVPQSGPRLGEVVNGSNIGREVAMGSPHPKISSAPRFMSNLGNNKRGHTYWRMWYSG
jgi:hypothetical protein